MLSCKGYLPKASAVCSAVRGSLCHCRARVRYAHLVPGLHGPALNRPRDQEVAAVARWLTRAEVSEANEGRKRGSGDQTGQ